MRRRTAAIRLLAVTLLTAFSVHAAPIRPFKYKSSNPTFPTWQDVTGNQLADGVTASSIKDPKTGKRVMNLVIFTNGDNVIDIDLLKPCRVNGIAIHCTRPNANYRLKRVALLSSEQGHWVERGSAEGFWGPVKQKTHIITIDGLDFTARQLRLKFEVPNVLSLAEIVIDGTPMAAPSGRTAAAAGAGVPLRDITDAEVREENTDADPAKEVVLENRFLRMIFDPVGGGTCVSLLVKDGRKEMVYPHGGANGKYGLFRDHLWEPYYFFAERPYSYRVEQQPDRAYVEMWTTGAGGMMSFTEARKRITIFKDSPRIRADFELKNQPSSQTDYVYAQWVHNFLGVLGEKTSYFFPTAKGVESITAPDFFADRQNERWFNDPPRSWTAFAGESGCGLGIDVENTYLNCFYTWGGASVLTPTLEWRYNRVEVSAGESIKTTAFLYPFTDMKRVDGAFGDLVVSLDLPSEPRPNEQITATVGVCPMEPGRIECVWRVRRLPEKEYREIARRTLTPAGWETSRITEKLSTGAAGTLAVNVQFFREGELLGDVETPVVVGGVSLPYARAPEGERKGLKGKAEETEVASRKLSTEFETVHVKWAKPFVNGPVKALFVTGENQSREVVELWQRMDLDFTYDKFLATKSDQSYLYAGDRSIKSLAQAQKKLDENLEQDYDVIVIGGMQWYFHFTKQERGKILDKVKAGTGLILISMIGVDDDLAAVPSVGKGGKKPMHAIGRWKATADHPITGALPWNVLPRTKRIQYSPPPGGEILAEVENGRRPADPLICVAEHGKGRVVSMNWNAFTHADNYMGYTGLTPQLSYRGAYQDPEAVKMFADRAGQNPTMPYHYWEYYYALLARATTWAGRKAPPVTVAAVEVTPTDLQRDAAGSAKCSVRLDSTGAFPGATVEAVYRDRRSQETGRAVKKVDIVPAVQRIALDPPANVHHGHSFVDVIVRDRHGRSLGWGAGAFRVVAPLRIASVDFAETEIDPGQPVRGTVKLDGQATGQEILRLELWDAWDRLLDIREKLPRAGGNPEIEFEFQPRDLIVPGLKVEAKLTGGLGRTMATAYGRAFVKPVRDRTKLNFISWSFNYKWRSHYLFPYVYKRVMELGIDSAMDGMTEESTGKVWDDVYHGSVWTPLGLLSYMDSKEHRKFADDEFAEKSKAFKRTGDKKHLERKPCLDDPEFRKIVRKTMVARAEAARKYGFGYSYCMGDEMSLTDHAAYFDYCYSPHTLQAFRKWLEKRYGTLAALNRHWQTSFARWDGVMPMTADEAAKRKGAAAGNHAPWADHREYMDHTLADFFALIEATLKEVDPQSVAGLSGTQRPAAGNGMDWWLMSKSFSYYNSYNTAWSEEMRRAFRRSTGVMTAPYYAGYWTKGRHLENRLWFCLLHDTNDVSAWTTRLFFYGDLSFSESGRDTRDYLNELKDGIWELMRNSERLGDGIAVHYSQPSLRANFIRGREREFDKTRDAWVDMMHDLGLQLDFIAYAEIEQGLLNRRGYKVLVLPQSAALSAKEIEEIETFVRNGGLLLADNTAAIMDEHCRAADAPLLDSVFGVTRARTKTQGKPSDSLTITQPVGGLAKGTKIKVVGLEPELRAKGATAMADSSEDFPMILVHRLGRGEAVYLNMDLGQYPADRVFHSPTEKQLQQVILGVLGRAGVKPAVSLTYANGEPPHGDIARYRNGEIEFVGVLRDLEKGAEARRATLGFDRKARVYDVRAGKSLGVSTSVQTVLESGQAKLYALVPADAPPSTIRVEAVKSSVRPGGAVEYRVTGRPFADIAGGVVRVDVVKPDGNIFRPYCSNHVLKRGEAGATGHFRLALNDAPGEWTLRVKDVTTGTKAEARVNVGE